MNLEKVISDNDIEIVEVKYASIDGRLRSISFPVDCLDRFLKKGIGVDGSSIGLKSTENSDMRIKPDKGSFYIDPFSGIPTVIIMGHIATSERYEPCKSDPRNILKKTVALFKEEEISDGIKILPEFEFYLFKSCEFSASGLDSSVRIIPGEGNQSEDGYHADYPYDRFKEFRSEMIKILENTGINVKYSHHEVGKYGQYEVEIDMEEPIRAADSILLTKYLVHRLAEKRELVCTFMPKVIKNEPGNGMHFHVLLERDGNSIFYDRDREDHLSEELDLFTGGILKHGRAISSFTNPTTNSYKRLFSGFEAPRELSRSIGSRKSAIRIPDYARGEDIDIEYRPPDATCNPYLAISAILLAGRDGFNNRDNDEYLEGEIEKMPENLLVALRCLKEDSEFLTEKGIFPSFFIDKWIKEKTIEYWKIENTPSPSEFLHYFSL